MESSAGAGFGVRLGTGAWFGAIIWDVTGCEVKSGVVQGGGASARGAGDGEGVLESSGWVVLSMVKVGFWKWK